MPTALTLLAIPMVAAFLLPSGRAEAAHKIVINGSCQYPDRVARHRFDTVLILCDTATIEQGATRTTLGFGQRSWGQRARFAGVMTGNKMAVAQLSLRSGQMVKATGTCEIFHRGDGNVAAIRCLARAGSRFIAANFVPSVSLSGIQPLRRDSMAVRYRLLP